MKSPYLQLLGCAAASLFLTSMNSDLQAQKANYDESKIPHYTLPDPLKCIDDSIVDSVETWKSKRRPEILNLFATQMFGKAPPAPKAITANLLEKSGDALGGKAIRKQLAIALTDKGDGPAMHLLLYLPISSATKPAPVFLGLNFNGNHTVHADPAIRFSHYAKSRDDKPARDEDRGSSSSRWAIDFLLKEGFGLATIYYGDIDPDFHDEFKNGVHPHFYQKGQTLPAKDEWGSIAAWSWGLSRAMDYLITDPGIDAKRVCLMGHSRLGKTSLWGGANDERFSLVVSNNSGCGGAAISRRRIGESVRRINTSFPHWFCENYKQYNDNESAAAFDQHMLVALMAPRPVLVCSATEDRWADPKGEFLAAFHAGPVYKLFGKEAIKQDKMPEPLVPPTGAVGYHLRPGKHDVTLLDWQAYVAFAKRNLR